MDIETFQKYWPYISSELDSVPHIWRRYHTKDSICMMVMSGDTQVWGVGPKNQIRLIVFTRVLTYPASKVFQVWLAFGGDVEKCLPNLIASLERAAIDAGCQSTDIIGRPGWEKFIPGFKRQEVILSKSLDYGRMQ